MPDLIKISTEQTKELFRKRIRNKFEGIILEDDSLGIRVLFEELMTEEDYLIWLLSDGWMFESEKLQQIRSETPERIEEMMEKMKIDYPYKVTVNK